MSAFYRLCAGTAMLTLVGCAVGPSYEKPATEQPAAYKESLAAGEAWSSAQPADAALRGNWWETFGDADLNSLEEQLSSSNQNLKIADARFRQARALVGYSRAEEFPTLSVAPAIDSVRRSPAAPYPYTNVYTAGDYVLPLDLSYEVDLWGRVRHTVTAAKEEAQASAADLQTANLSLHAELAMDYFRLRAADAQQALLDSTVQAYTDALQLTRSRVDGGAAPESDVAQAQTQLDTARVADTDIGIQRAQYEHAIAVLVGKPPAAFTLAARPLDLEPPAIPVGLPSTLLQRRPDIAAAERRMAEANEQIGIAQSAYYPSVSLGGTVGLEGHSLTNWLDWPNLFWAVGLSMGETLFDGGRRRATSTAARANYDATVATYRQTTLGAFQQVEDNLAALRILERESRQQKEAVDSARNSLQLFTNRYVGGADTYLQVISAQTIALENERNEVDIRSRQMTASVLLIKALGGGWTDAALPQAGKPMSHQVAVQ